MINYIKGIVILTILFLSSGSICSSQENYQNNTGYLSNIKAIAAGGGHSLALDNNGTVWAWGDNEYGQLGNGTNSLAPQPVPVQVTAGVGQKL